MAADWEELAQTENDVNVVSVDCTKSTLRLPPRTNLVENSRNQSNCGGP